MATNHWWPLVLATGKSSFGLVLENNAFVWPIKIFNPNDEDVSIKGFLLSCACTKIKPNKAILKGHSSVSFDLLIDLTLKEGARQHEFSSVPFSSSVLPLTDKPLKQTQLFIKGEVSPMLFFDGRKLDFGNVVEGDHLQKGLSVKALVPLETLTAEDVNKGLADCTNS